MLNYGLLTQPAQLPAARPGRKPSWRRLSAYFGLSVGALASVVLALLYLLDGAILDTYGKKKIERAFARAYPGSVLRIGALNYALGVNRLVALSVSLSTTNASFKAGEISLTGVRWFRFLCGTSGRRCRPA